MALFGAVDKSELFTPPHFHAVRRAQAQDGPSLHPRSGRFCASGLREPFVCSRNRRRDSRAQETRRWRYLRKILRIFRVYFRLRRLDKLCPGFRRARVPRGILSKAREKRRRPSGLRLGGLFSKVTPPSAGQRLAEVASVARALAHANDRQRPKLQPWRRMSRNCRCASIMTARRSRRPAGVTSEVMVANPAGADSRRP